MIDKKESQCTLPELEQREEQLTNDPVAFLENPTAYEEKLKELRKQIIFLQTKGGGE